MTDFTKAIVEETALAWFEVIGYAAQQSAALVPPPEVSDSAEVLENVETKSRGIRAQVSDLQRAILEYRRPADELIDELRFDMNGNGYALTRGGQPVSNVSEGERTAIAFLYFLKSLQDKDFDMEKGIVVIDDLVSSLDANALFSAFGYMKERTRNVVRRLLEAFLAFRFPDMGNNLAKCLNRVTKRGNGENHPVEWSESGVDEVRDALFSHPLSGDLPITVAERTAAEVL